MQVSDDRKSSESKLLAFRPQPERSTQGTPSPAFHLGQGPHEVARLRRPVPVEQVRAARLEERDGLAHDARNLLTSLEFIAGMLAEPGVLSEDHKHLAGELRLVAEPLGALVERMAVADRSAGLSDQAPAAGSGKDAVFAREPLRPSLARTGRAGAAKDSRARDDQRHTQVDAGMMIKNSERLLSAIAGPSVKVLVAHEHGVGELALGSEEVTRVLINLVKNASEAMPDGGQVTITVRRSMGSRPGAILTVEDTGAGIPAHALGQVFQAGFTSKEAHRSWPATAHHGLGLTIVRSLVEGAGGSIRVTSILKKGTTFEIKLPCRGA